jgi:hypothetical protein
MASSDYGFDDPRDGEQEDPRDREAYEVYLDHEDRLNILAHPDSPCEWAETWREVWETHPQDAINALEDADDLALGHLTMDDALRLLEHDSPTARELGVRIAPKVGTFAPEPLPAYAAGDPNDPDWLPF